MIFIRKFLMEFSSELLNWQQTKLSYCLFFAITRLYTQLHTQPHCIISLILQRLGLKSPNSPYITWYVFTVAILTSSIERLCPSIIDATF